MSAVSLLFLQIACILAACRAIGWVAGRVRQPLVVGEMVAGFLMGPSFFGWLAPDAHAWLFPATSLPAISLFSQLGLVLYMFCVGVEFGVEPLKRYGRTALAISAAGVLVPFVLGGSTGMLLFERGGLFAPDVSRRDAVMFLGTALSITAFPMLARIISERKLQGTTVGLLALSAGAVDDAAAWIILALVLSSLAGGAVGTLATVAGALAYGLAVFGVVRPVLKRLARRATADDGVSPSFLMTILGLLMLGACFTDVIRMHPVFGAFVLGLAVPRGIVAERVRASLEPVTSTLLVPLFFAYAGLSSQLGLIDSPTLWLTTALILVVACVGKGLGCWAAARISGIGNRDALVVATLMNCRGMVGLILLSIGLEYQVITPTFFTMLTLMAIGTTAITGPIVSLLDVREAIVRSPAVVGVP